MRIAYLTQSYPPMISGAAISAQQIAEALSNRGHKVMVIAASDKEFAYHTYKENITIMRLRSFNNPLRVGQRFIPNPRHRVMKALKQFKPDVIHTHARPGRIVHQYPVPLSRDASQTLQPV